MSIKGVIHVNDVLFSSKSDITIIYVVLWRDVKKNTGGVKQPNECTIQCEVKNVLYAFAVLLHSLVYALVVFFLFVCLLLKYLKAQSWSNVRRQSRGKAGRDGLLAFLRWRRLRWSKRGVWWRVRHSLGDLLEFNLIVFYFRGRGGRVLRKSMLMVLQRQCKCSAGVKTPLQPESQESCLDRLSITVRYSSWYEGKKKQSVVMELSFCHNSTQMLDLCPLNWIYFSLFVLANIELDIIISAHATLVQFILQL